MALRSSHSAPAFVSLPQMPGEQKKPAHGTNSAVRTETTEETQ